MSLTLHSDEHFMQIALKEAMTAFDRGEVPIGCVIVKAGRIIGRGSNQVEALHDPTAHAEILAIGAACNQLDNWRLEDCTLYVTLEPCPMCAGAILNSRISRVVFGAYDRRLGALGSVYDILSVNPLGKAIEVVPELQSRDCLGLIQDFFRQLRDKKKNQSLAADLPSSASSLSEQDPHSHGHLDEKTGPDEDFSSEGDAPSEQTD